MNKPPQAPQPLPGLDGTGPAGKAAGETSDLPDLNGPDNGPGTSPPDTRGPVTKGQGSLFDGDDAAAAEGVGYRGPVACKAAGISYRQLDYWARTDFVTPEVRGASGSGSQRLYSFRDILLLRVIKRLLDAGIALRQVKVAIEHLRARGIHDMSQVTLISDGISVYECTEDDQLRDLLAGGQGMFAIGLGGVCKDVAGSLHNLPAQRLAGSSEDSEIVFAEDDELAKRRAAKRRAG